MQNLKFGKHVCPVISFLMNLCKLDLNKVCDGNNVLNDWRSIVKLSFLFRETFSGSMAQLFSDLGVKLEIW